MEKKQTKLEYEKRWKGMKQYFMVPSILITHQKRLGLSNNELVTLLHLIEKWWVHDRRPFPTIQSLAEQMDIKYRTVQRYLDGLKKQGLITVKSRKNASGGRSSNEYDLSGLVNKVNELSKEIKGLEKASHQPGKKKIDAMIERAQGDKT